MKRSIKLWFAVGLAAGSLSLAACGEEEPAPTPHEDPVVEAVEPAEPEEPTAEQVPVPEDFAAEAEAEITADNYQAELAAIEASLGTEEGEDAEDGEGE